MADKAEQKIPQIREYRSRGFPLKPPLGRKSCDRSAHVTVLRGPGKVSFVRGRHSQAGVGHEILTRVPVQRPPRKQFVRCHPRPLMVNSIATYIDEGDGETS